MSPESSTKETAAKPVKDKKRGRWAITRRGVLIGLGTGVGLLAVGIPLGLHYGRPKLVEALDGSSGPFAQDAPFDPDLWFEITPEKIIFFVPKIEMGQGIHTALAQLAAEELEVKPQQLTVTQADTARGYEGGVMFSFGSTSVKSLYKPVRQAAATLRELLRAEAAQQLEVDISKIKADAGRFFVAGSRKVLAYGAVVKAKEGEWTVPEEPAELKPRKDFKRIGKEFPRVDWPAKLLGEATFGYDPRQKGMLYGAIARPPRYGATLAEATAGDAMSQAGVKKVVIDLGTSFAGVVAETRIQARKALERLQLRWEGGTRANQADIDELITANSGAVLRRRGNVGQALQQGQRVEAEYRTPLAAHAHLEPLGALVSVPPKGKIEVWASAQYPATVIRDIQAILGKDREVVVQPTELGGSFGRKAGQTAAVEAARLSAAVGKPVHVGWTREEDLQQAFYRPPTHHVFKGSVSSEGRILGVEQYTASGDIIWGTTGMPEFVRDLLGFDPGGLLGQFLAYDFPAYRVINRREQLPVPTGFWRGLGIFPNTFAVESFVDELAHAAKKDPLEFRLANLGRTEKDQRLRKVLQRAAKESGWTKKPPEGRARGIACCLDIGTAVAQVAEVSVKDVQIRVHRVTVAVDPGMVVNPEGAKMQSEGSVVMGLSSTLREELTVKDGMIEAANFDRYPLLTLAETPQIDVFFEESSDEPQGLGEPVIGPVAAAVGNAVFALTGKRLRNLPLKL